MSETSWDEGRAIIGDFLDKVDGAIAVRLLRTATPFETTLTQELFALLDPDASAREHPDDDLHKELRRRLGESLDDAGLVGPEEVEPWSAEITTVMYPQKYEAYVSQADLGLVIDYSRSAGRPALPSAVFLLQAKKLYPARDGDGSTYFHVRCAFSAMDKDQHCAMTKLQAKLRKGNLRYLYYMPRHHCFTEVRRVPSRTSLATMHWLQQLPAFEGPDDGVWIGGIERGVAATTAAQVHEQYPKNTVPFRIFLLDHMTRAGVFGGSAGAAAGSRRSDRRSDLAHGLAVGEQWAIDAVIDPLMAAGIVAPVLPAARMQLTIPPVPKPKPSLGLSLAPRTR